ncbi:MAG: quinolinate synthase NadA [Weeksellaceae bacterium]|jgi:quinolinate synthase|nr:quinolinate synthase NadA [Weeksellaceae bacterium]
METLLTDASTMLDKKGFLDIEIPEGTDLIAEINRMRKEKNAIILAHYYQIPEIQDISDFLGDSLQLARAAAETDADMIVFCGVHFMAEAAKILNPTKKVVLPDLKAGCSLADSCSGEGLRAMRAEHPNAIVISYINCDAGVKAESDIIVTSSNAKTILDSLPQEQEIIFAPDKNLGKYLNKVTGRNMILWDGACIVHEAFSLERIARQLAEHPNAKLIAHPESEEPVLNASDFVGSTSRLLNFVQTDDAQEFIVATEAGIIHEMQKMAPGKTLIPAMTSDENNCNCSECFFMKRNTMEKVYLCMKYELPEILIEEELRQRAEKSITKMLDLSVKVK